MPPTTGNDTINGGALATDIDGLAGDDLLILRYGNQINGVAVASLFITLPAPFLTSSLQLANGSVRNFSINNFECFDITVGYLNARIDLSQSDGDNRIVTGSRSDVIVVGSGSNVIFAGAGQDKVGLAQGVGHNNVNLGDGNDTVYAVELEDTVQGGAGIDVIRFDLSAHTAGVSLNLQGLSTSWLGFENFVGVLTDYDDVLRTTVFPNRGAGFYGGDGTDKLIINFSDSVTNLIFVHDYDTGEIELFRMYGSAQGDYITTGDGDDLLVGNAGNDTLYAGGGRDSVYGGAGDDILTADSFDDLIFGGTGHDSVLFDFSEMSHGVVLTKAAIGRIWKGTEQFYGGLTPFDDVLNAGAATANIGGGRGHDRLILDYSAATMPDQVNIVRFQFDYRSAKIIFSEAAAMDPLPYTGTIRLLEFEEFRITGTSQPDSFFMGRANDTVFGGLSSDTIRAGDGDDRIFGDQGHDVLNAGRGLDMALGGSGNDTFSGFDLEDTINGQSGHDEAIIDLRARTTAVRFDLSAPGEVAWQGIETVSGFMTRLNDHLTLGAILGASLNGSLGSDTVVLDYAELPRTATQHIGFSNESVVVYANSSVINPTDAWRAYFPNFENFVIRFGNGNDAAALGDGFGRNRLSGLGGNDTFFGSYGRDDLSGDDGNDYVFGDRGADNLYGGEGADTVEGGDGTDSLYGGMDDDLVVGGAGADRMTGGGGADVFWFAGASQTASDVITDYRTEDIIDISGGIQLEDVTVTRTNGDAFVRWAHGSIHLEDIGQRAINFSFASE
jgi:Ca2+-binding RTX toxin-like protein